MTRTTLSGLLLASCSGLVLVMAAACGRGSEESRSEPLLDERWPADVLVERRPVNAASAVAGNRLLQGWRYRLEGEALRAVPEKEGGRLEIVNLDRRRRGLLLGLAEDLAEGRAEDAEGLAEDTVEDAVEDVAGELILSHQGREIARTPVTGAGEVALDLPVDLPLGRVALDLTSTPPVALALERTGLRSVKPAGEVTISGGAVRQSGWSIVDVTRPVEPGSVVKGRLELPSSGGDQRFELRVEVPGEDGKACLLADWRPGRLDRLFGGGDFALPTGDAELVRVRLLATGTASATATAGLDGQATWRDLRVEGPGVTAGSKAAASSSVPAPTDRMADRAASPKIPPAPPLVVLYVFDALRGDAVGHLGGDAAAAPTLDRLASEGVAFLDHQSVAPNTTGSTKSLFTGRYFPLLGEMKLPEGGPATLAELFRRAGYRTGAFSGNGNLSRPLGNVRGFEVLARRPSTEPRRSERSYNDDAERVHAAAFEWMDGLGAEERIFLYLHTVHPHSPYDPPEPFRGRFVTEGASALEGDRDTLKRLTALGPEGVTAADRRRLRQLYAGGLAYNDAHLRSFLEGLAGRAGGRDLLVIVTSDHGEELYDHGGILHGFTLYREMLHVPLIFWWPGTLEARRVERPTDAVDLHLTLRRLLDLPPAEDLGEARSLWPLLLGDGRRGLGKMRFAVKSGRGVTYHMVENGRYKLIWAPADGRVPGMGRGGARGYDLEEVYDLRRDPEETVNLAGEPILEVAWLRARLRGFIERGSRLEVGEEVGDFDDETLRILKALGYVD